MRFFSARPLLPLSNITENITSWNGRQEFTVFFNIKYVVYANKYLVTPPDYGKCGRELRRRFKVWEVPSLYRHTQKPDRKRRPEVFIMIMGRKLAHSISILSSTRIMRFIFKHSWRLSWKIQLTVVVVVSLLKEIWKNRFEWNSAAQVRLQTHKRVACIAKRTRKSDNKPCIDLFCLLKLLPVQ